MTWPFTLSLLFQPTPTSPVERAVVDYPYGLKSLPQFRSSSSLSDRCRRYPATGARIGAGDAARRQPPACMGIRGLGPDHPERARSTVDSPGCPSPVSPTVAPYYPFAHPYASWSRSAYTAATGAL